MNIFKLFTLTFLSLLLMSDAASACFDSWGLSKETLSEVSSQAYAIGMFEVSDSDQKNITYKTIASYNDFQEKKIKVYSPPEFNMCGPSRPDEKGKLYNLIIIRKEGQFILHKGTLSDNDWEVLGEKKSGSSIWLSRAICRIGDGTWEVINNGYGYPHYGCRYYASDAYKICQDSQECEGTCLALLKQKDDGDEENDEVAQERIKKIRLSGESFGRCSILRKPKECKYVMVDGKSVQDVCYARKKKDK